MKIFLICPVRNASKAQIENLKKYKETLAIDGHEVFYPADDNPYENTDSIGYIICGTNKKAIAGSDEVHIFWDKTSSGSLFDLGVAFALNKPLKIVNIEEVLMEENKIEGKSFSKMILEWNSRRREN